MNTERQQHVLVVIGPPSTQTHSLASITGRAGWRTMVFSGPAEAEASLAARKALNLSALLVDEDALGGLVETHIAELKKRCPELPIIFATTDASAGMEAIRAGASDYLMKPMARDRLMHSLRLATTPSVTPGELRFLAEDLQLPSRFESMIGADPAFRKALARAAKAARSQRNILVQGEIGTGKDMLLKAMHSASPRAAMPLEIVRVRAVAPTAMESTLFGHEESAFPGAFERQAGALERSDGGTLLIEEINRMPEQAQGKLAEVLASSRVRPIGASHTFHVDVRFFAAANRSLSGALDRGEFNRDLYQNLSAIEIDLPPLRDRAGDIPALARYFLACISEQAGLPELGLTNGAVSLLCSFDWPGNVRQLQAVLFRAAVSCEGDALTADHFNQLFLDQASGPHRPPSSPGSTLGGVVLYTEEGHLRPLEEIEYDIIRLAIGHYRGRMSEVARRLGIGRSTLYRKLSELGLETTQ